MVEKDFELIYIIPNKFTDEEVPSITSKIEGVIKSTGLNLLKTENLGKRKLAYPIKQFNHGYYILSEFKGGSDNINKLSNQLALMADVLRHSICMKVETGLDAAKRARLAQEMQVTTSQTVEYKAPSKPFVPVAPAPASGKKYVPDIEKELGLSSEGPKQADTINEPPPEGDKKVDISALDEILKDL